MRSTSVLNVLVRVWDLWERNLPVRPARRDFQLHGQCQICALIASEKVPLIVPWGEPDIFLGFKIVTTLVFTGILAVRVSDEVKRKPVDRGQGAISPRSM